jgi:hypothetical protein
MSTLTTKSKKKGSQSRKRRFFSKRQKVIILSTVLLALFVLGLKRTTLNFFGDQVEKWRCISLYGVSIIEDSEGGKSNLFLDPLWTLAPKRYYVAVAIIIMGLAGTIISKKVL